MKLYNAKTYRAVFLAWVQAWGGWLWHLPGRAWNVYRYHTEPKVDPAEFKARIDASIARLDEERRKRLAARQAKADAATAALKKNS